MTTQEIDLNDPETYDIDFFQFISIFRRLDEEVRLLTQRVDGVEIDIRRLKNGKAARR